MRIKANHGQPLDVWQLDFSVSQRVGEMVGSFDRTVWQIESEVAGLHQLGRTRCRHVPTSGGGPTRLTSFQESGRNVVSPGQTLTETKYYIVLQGDPRPRFVKLVAGLRLCPQSTADGHRGDPRRRHLHAGQPSAAAANPEQETVFWQSIMDSTNPTMFEAYMEQFPDGVFRALAEARLAELRAPVGNRPAAGSDSPAAGAGRVASTPADAPLRAGETRVFDGMEFVWVPAGEFRMGSTSSEAVDDEQPVTQVRISRAFWLGKHEVTQPEWQGVMGTNPSEFSGCAQCPVERVSWNDARGFIARLNEQGGGNRYRLPTEAEWEYAARAGTTGDRYGNLDAIAWYGENSGFRTHPVGGKAANAWGLHDMLGNVWEWVGDWYGRYPGGSVTDPRGPGSGSARVFRGGGWNFSASFCRSSLRYAGTPGNRFNLLGFRLLRTVP